MENRESRIDNGKGTKDGLDGRVAKGREEERGGERRRGTMERGERQWGEEERMTLLETQSFVSIAAKQTHGHETDS